MLLTVKDKRRIEVIQSVMDQKIQVGDAAKLLHLSQRQIWRLLAAVRSCGIEGAVHGNRGRQPWNRADAEMWGEVLSLIRERYLDINDLHLKEILEREHQIVVGRESLRLKLRAADIGPKRKRRVRKARSRRERRPASGLMLQIDGSPHDWLQGRGPKLTLVGAIDDATSCCWCRFFDSETTWSYLTLMRRIFLTKGLPMSLYSDRHDIFRSNREPSIIEQLNGELPLSQFGRAMDALGISIIAANSPQAKGRIERLWETFQDRLVVELRLAKAKTIDDANAVLDRVLKSFNSKFTIAPADPIGVWRKPPRAYDLDRILCIRVQRSVALDHTVRFENLILPIPRGKLAPSLANQHVAVLQLRDGSIEIIHRNQRVARFPPSEVQALRKLLSTQSKNTHNPPPQIIRRVPVPPPSGGTGGGLQSPSPYT